MLQQILTAWGSLSVGRRITAIIGASVATLTLFLLVQLATAPGYALLYGNLGPSQAGEVVTALDRQNAKYQVRGNAIYVEERRRDELRMLLASEGLPPNSISGYELLDKLSGFGTTSQMFDAAYSRAIEGELARSIMASSFAREARVHISRGALSPFQGTNSVTASVFVKPSNFEISKDNAKALKFLVASSVAGLSVDSVAIIDATTGRVINDNAFDDSPNGAEDRASVLQLGVIRLLEAHVGRGNAKVEINMETERQTESILERKFDPNGRVAISTDNQEVSRSSSGPAGGAVTVASNVPSGNAGNTPGESTTQNSEIRERTNYEVSEIERQVQISPGSIKRLSVAVLVEGVYEVDGNGTRAWRPRTEIELEDIRELVQSAVGFNSDRGDMITIKSLQFDSVSETGSGTSVGLFDITRLDPMSLIQISILSAVILVLGLFVIRPILLGRNEGTPTSRSRFDEVPSLNVPTDESRLLEEGNIEDTGIDTLPSFGDFNSPMAVIDDFDLDGKDDEHDSSVAQLKKVIESRQADSVEILRNWLETSDTEIAA